MSVKVKTCPYIIISPGVWTLDNVNNCAAHCHTFIEIKGNDLINYKENKLNEIKSINVIPRTYYTLSFVLDGLENWKDITSIEQGSHNFIGGVIGNYPKQIWIIVRLQASLNRLNIYHSILWSLSLYIFVSFWDTGIAMAIGPNREELSDLFFKFTSALIFFTENHFQYVILLKNVWICCTNNAITRKIL